MRRARWDEGGLRSLVSLLVAYAACAAVAALGVVLYVLLMWALKMELL